ncbi:MAG: UDP-N-acetylmuramate--L-alanine ligase [Acidobacteria bacterium]|nr:UDP-N-acetylmuramate--L-alanine ligase [Acidobacteriota bacterium]
MFTTGVRVHIVGVAGAGMSALAVYLKGYGCVVSGCDAANSPVLEQLRELGVAVTSSHDARHVANADVLLWSPAVASTHPELEAAREHGVALMTRAQVLGEVSAHSRVIGITGTHGKTTATSMLVHIMRAAGRDDSRLVGATLRGVGFAGHHGVGDVIAEVDESYGAFSELTPFALGLLNVEADHLDHYGSLENLEAAFVDVLSRSTGPVVVWGDDPGARRVASQLRRPWTSVGTDDQAQWVLREVALDRYGSRARLVGPREVVIELGVIGRHNLANAAVAAVLALSLDVPLEAVGAGLARFRGAPRRFERVATWRGVDVVDDYAHLPGEIAATVAAARAAGYQRIVAVFQPHRVTRTLNVGDAFAPSFDDVDTVIVTDIYTAGEDNPRGVTGEVVADVLRRRGRTATYYAATLGESAAVLERVASDADLVLLLGAGNVNEVLEHLEASRDLPRATDAGDPVGVPGAPGGVRRFFLGTGPHVTYDAALGARTTYRVGGSVAALVTLGSEDDLGEFCARAGGAERPVVVIGNGSNLLVADGWHDVVAVRLAGEFLEVTVSDDDQGVLVVVGAGIDLPVVARRLAGEGVVGFEWAVGVPGTFGGAVAMNAGGHGSEMRASVQRVQVCARGRLRWRDAREMDFSYRSSALAAGEIVTRVALRLRRGDAAAARAHIGEIVRWRREHQPGGANAGSVFRNPEGDSAGRLIEAAGLKGYRRGTAAISDKHANFIIADADGSANDVMLVMRDVRSRVGETTGVWLETEHRFVGFSETW